MSASALWLTSVGYHSLLGTNYSTMLENQCNLETECIGYVFLMVHDDVINSYLIMSEPCEHYIAGWSQEKREQTILECVKIE